MEKTEIVKMVERMMLEWKEFVIELGYTEEQGELFAKGYAAKLEELPLPEQIEVLKTGLDVCMSAGYIAAGIDEDEAFETFANKFVKEINEGT